MPVTITTRVGDDLAKKIEEIAKSELLDKSAVIRKLLVKAIREREIEEALRAYEQGKITLWQAANSCNLSLFEIIDEVKRLGIHVPYTLEDLKEDLGALSE